MPLSPSSSLSEQVVRTRLDVTEVEIIDNFSESIFAASDELSALQPDDSKAYVRMRLCHCLPSFIGPEMKNGLVFGFHPKAMARCYQTLLHQQTNIGHRLAANGTAANDAINGCIIAVSFPEGWEDQDELPATAAQAPYLDVVAVMFKKAKGVTKLLGQHLSSQNPWSVSIETRLVFSECGVYDTRDGSIKAMADLEPGLVRKVKGSPVLAKLKGGDHLCWVLGGADGSYDFSLNGIGYVPVPAEKPARIVDLAASAQDDSQQLCLLAGSEPEFYEGVGVRWNRLTASCFGRGEVSGVVYEGSVVRHGCTVLASAEDPVLLIKKPNGVEVARPASSVRKVN